jgi:hypothetical protein
MMALAYDEIDWKTLESGVRPDILEMIDTPLAPGIGTSGWPRTCPLPDGVHEILLDDFVFEWRGKRYVIPRGFVTDYASVPRFFQRLVPQRGKYSPAALIHDFFYWSGLVSKAEADAALYEISGELGVCWADRQLLLRGVQLGFNVSVGGANIGVGAPKVWADYRKKYGTQFSYG